MVGYTQAHTHKTATNKKTGEVKMTHFVRPVAVFPENCIIPARKFGRKKTWFQRFISQLWCGNILGLKRMRDENLIM